MTLPLTAAAALPGVVAGRLAAAMDCSRAAAAHVCRPWSSLSPSLESAAAAF